MRTGLSFHICLVDVPQDFHQGPHAVHNEPPILITGTQNVFWESQAFHLGL